MTTDTEKKDVGTKKTGSRWASALWSRLTDPLVLVLLTAAALTSLAFRSPQWTSPRGEVFLRGSGASRFLIQPYPLPGPILLENLSTQAKADFTLNGRIPVSAFPRDDRSVYNLTWSSSEIDQMVVVADKRNADVGKDLCSYGPACNKGFFAALDAHPIQGQDVLIVGSVTPWLEATCLSFKANSTTTVDFNVPKVSYPKISVMTIPELDATTQVFDSVFSYSSLEHDGLGRYGDPLNPIGDLQRMEKLKGLLRPGGKLYLGVPNGPDFLLFNAHRVYGSIRFPMLIQGWNLEGTYGEDLQEAFKGKFTVDPICIPKALEGNRGCYTQPVHVLSIE